MRRLIIAYDGSTQPASRGGVKIESNIRRLSSIFSDSPPHIVRSMSIPHLDFMDGRCLINSLVNGYIFITQNFIPGDKLFIFGFSRGAFAARILANFVARFGVLWKRDGSPWDAVKSFRDGTLDDIKVKKVKPHESCDREEGDLTPRVYEVEIEVVGCWDTVPWSGIPLWPLTNVSWVTDMYKHFDAGLVKALDECRGPFTPTLWRLPDDPEVAKSIDLQQCWFPGPHSNVGGGYPDTALADISLAWMIDRCRPFLDFDTEYVDKIIARGRRPGEMIREGKFDVEYQGWGRGMCYDSYKEGSSWTWNTRTPGGYGAGTNETFHSSVRERWTSSRRHGLTTGPAIWSPKALEGFTPRQKEGSDEWEWVKNGGVDILLTIPEAHFGTTEWQLRYAPEKISKCIHAKAGGT